MGSNIQQLTLVKVLMDLSNMALQINAYYDSHAFVVGQTVVD